MRASVVMSSMEPGTILRGFRKLAFAVTAGNPVRPDAQHRLHVMRPRPVEHFLRVGSVLDQVPDAVDQVTGFFLCLDGLQRKDVAVDV